MSNRNNNDNYIWWIIACIILLVGSLVLFFFWPEEIPALILAIVSVICGLRGNKLLMKEVNNELEEKTEDEPIN